MAVVANKPSFVEHHALRFLIIDMVRACVGGRLGRVGERAAARLLDGEGRGGWGEVNKIANMGVRIKTMSIEKLESFAKDLQNSIDKRRKFEFE